MEIFGANLSFCKNYLSTFSLHSNFYKLEKEMGIYKWTLYNNFLIVSADITYNFSLENIYCYKQLLLAENYCLIEYLIDFNREVNIEEITFLEKDLNKRVRKSNIYLYVTNFLNSVRKQKYKYVKDFK